MKIRPLQDRVIVKRVEEEEKTKGGIIIPDTAKEKPMEGKVIAVGKGGQRGKRGWKMRRLTPSCWRLTPMLRADPRIDR